MSDEENGETSRPRQLSQQVEDLGLHGHVEAVVGSSAMRSWGWDDSAMAIITRCLIPPDS